LNQTKLEKILHEDFKSVKKFPLDESIAFRELHDLVKDTESNIIFNEKYLRVNDKVLDIENHVFFIVSGEIED